jgi:predicted Co/Zn/Cd cation transporter (cation efflux family)
LISVLPAEREQEMLRASTVIAGGMAAVGVTWGIVGNSQMILFDGAYSLIGVGLSGLTLRAAQLIESGPTRRYPYGRESLAPLVIGLQGLALLATCAYAAAEPS